MIFPMNHVGTPYSPCEELVIADDDRIVSIDAESDGLTLRKVAVHLLSGKGKVFGGFKGPWNDHPTHRFDFTRKIDLLGVYGLVAIDPVNPALKGKKIDHIESLGFITNECPIRSMADFIHDLPPVSRLERVEEFVIAEAGDPVLAIVLVSLMSALAICAIVYFCLKNRADLCKKKRSRSHDEEIQIGNDSI